MMLQDTKFFPGHPNNMGQAAYNNSFTRKDIFNQRKQREFIPEAKKDDCYWDRRRRNNEAAKRSREKRRLNDMLLETRVIELSKDNHIMKCQLNAVFEKYGICTMFFLSVCRIGLINTISALYIFWTPGDPGTGTSPTLVRTLC